MTTKSNCLAVRSIVCLPFGLGQQRSIGKSFVHFTHSILNIKSFIHTCPNWAIMILWKLSEQVSPYAFVIHITGRME